MNPFPWSPSALNTLKNCGRQYHERYVLKSIPWEESAEAAHGNEVHTSFEKFLDVDQPLPSDLSGHEAYLKAIDQKPGYFYAEVAAGFKMDGSSCIVDWRKKIPPREEIWGWFKIDYVKILEGSDPVLAQVYDWKSGKKKPDWLQLSIYALWTFGMFPKVQLVDARYYWLQDHTESRKVWNREEIPALWNELLPDLKQFRDAFRNEVWTEKRSGLCNGWCPVKQCQHWQPKRS